MRAEGGEDEGGMGVSSIKVNGVEHCPRKPGHNVVVLDPIGDVYAVRNFNTNSGEGPAMGQFLNQLPEDHVVLVATQELTSREQGKGSSWRNSFSSLIMACYNCPDILIGKRSAYYAYLTCY